MAPKSIRSMAPVMASLMEEATFAVNSPAAESPWAIFSVTVRPTEVQSTLPTKSQILEKTLVRASQMKDAPLEIAEPIRDMIPPQSTLLRKLIRPWKPFLIG